MLQAFATVNASWNQLLILRSSKRFEAIVAFSVIVSKCQQPLLTAKFAFADRSRKTNYALPLQENIVILDGFLMEEIFVGNLSGIYEEVTRNMKYPRNFRRIYFR